MAPSHQHAGFAPTLETYLKSKLSLEASIETAVSLLKRRQIRGPEPCALLTAHVLSRVVAKSKWTDVAQLLDRVYQTGRKLVDAQPQELVIGNIMRRVLGLIRDEAAEERNEVGSPEPVAYSAAGSSTATTTTTTATTTVTAATPTTPAAVRPPLSTAPSFVALPRAVSRSATMVHTSQSMFNLLSAVDPLAAAAASNSVSASTSTVSASGPTSAAASGTSTPVPSTPTQPSSAGAFFASSPGRVHALRDEILDGIDEIQDEIGQADDQIAGFAEAQIRPGDFVLVYAPSKTVEKFLVKAAARRRYTLFLAGPGDYATLTKRLLTAKVSVVRIASHAIAAYMTRVARVVVDARAVAAHGGILVDRGSARVACVAHALGRTVLAVGGVYRVSPESWTDPEALIEWGSPAAGPARFADGTLVDGLDIATALTEYVPPGVVDIYVTNLGPHSRDYLDTVIADHYKKEDLELYQ